MAVNKVEYAGKTLLDLTSDTITPSDLTKGKTAHNAAGEKIQGTLNTDWFYVGRFTSGTDIATLKEYSEVCIICVPTEESGWGKFNSILFIPVLTLDSNFVKTNGISFSGLLNGVPWSGNVKFNSNTNTIYYSEVYFNNGGNIAGSAIMYIYLR